MKGGFLVMRFFKKGSFILMIALFGVLAACSDDSGDTAGTDNADNDEIFIGQISWPENIAVTNMWKAVLEQEGYDVKLELVDMGPQMTSLAEEDLDVAPEVWLPVQDKNYYEEYKDDVNFFDEPWYENGKVGLAVPEFMDDINSIEDLNENKDLFNGDITGFEPGAGTMEVTEEVLEDYDLEYDLIDSSESAMVSAVIDAAEEGEPIVAPLWQPHYIFAEADLKFLEDPEKTYGETEEIFMATRKGFESDQEEVFNWMQNFKLDDDQLGDLMVQVQENEDDPFEGAQNWVEENQDIVEEWME